MIDVPVRVKDALRDGRLKKNYRFVVLNSDGSTDFTIDNNTLVSESVKFDERMCSGDTIKFGLCEGSSLEFRYFDHVNINGRRLNSFIDVEYLAESVDVSGKTLTAEKNGSYTFKSKNNTYTLLYVFPGGGMIPELYQLNSENNYQQQIELLVGDEYYIADDVVVTVSFQGGLRDFYSIPMGYFTVEKCPRQASTGIYKVTAYNKLQSTYLDAKANDKIMDIVKSGVIGGVNGVDVGTILDELLEGYSIKRDEETVSFVISSETIPSSDTSAIIATDITGTDNYGYLHSLDVTNYLTPNNFSANNFYRFRINFKAIFDAIYSYVDSSMLQSYFKYGSNVDILSNFLKGTTSFSQPLYVGTFQIRTSTDIEDFSIQTLRNEENYVTPWCTNITSLGFGICGLYAYDASQTRTWSQSEINQAKSRIQNLLFTQGYMSIEISARSDIEKTVITTAEAESLPDVTLRQLQAAVFEINAQYGQIDRITDLFEGVELNHSRLYPANSLFPANNLYPGGQGIRGDRSTYSKLWTDYQGIQKFRYLIITYKGLDENNKAKDMTLQRTINADGNIDYYMSDNWLFKNLTWSASDVGDYADAMVSKLRDVTWFPFEMWCAGLPYLETGDEIEITNDEGTYPSYILQRQLQGIQNLQDTFINGTLDVF